MLVLCIVSVRWCWAADVLQAPSESHTHVSTVSRCSPWFLFFGANCKVLCASTGTCFMLASSNLSACPCVPVCPSFDCCSYTPADIQCDHDTTGRALPTPSLTLPLLHTSVLCLIDTSADTYMVLIVTPGEHPFLQVPASHCVRWRACVYGVCAPLLLCLACG